MSEPKKIPGKTKFLKTITKVKAMPEGGQMGVATPGGGARTKPSFAVKMYKIQTAALISNRRL